MIDHATPSPLPQGMLGVGTARDLQAEATQEARVAGIVAGAWKRERRAGAAADNRHEAAAPPGGALQSTEAPLGSLVTRRRHSPASWCYDYLPLPSCPRCRLTERKPASPATLLRAQHSNSNATTHPANRLYRPAAFPDSPCGVRPSLGTSNPSFRGVGPTAAQRRA